MSLGFIVGVLRERRALRRHERWGRAMLDSHQAAALTELRRWVAERSPFYRRFHAGLESRPLAYLPVLTKGQLMESFDGLTTDPKVRLGEVREFLAALEGYRLFQDRYWGGRVLAEEQLAGRLRISPRAVMCSSEVLTDEARRRIRLAFGAEPFNVYAATEPAGIAAECERHRLHLFEDLVITEVVDDRNRPVPKGVLGAKVLVTVLFSRTQPLIRYEMSDTIGLSDSRCECGRELGLVERIEGRREDVLVLPAAGGATVSVHPNVFHRVLEPLPVRQWQLEQVPGALVLRIVPGKAAVVPATIVAALSGALADAGALPMFIEVELVDVVAMTPLGKAPLIKALGQGGTTRTDAPGRDRSAHG